LSLRQLTARPQRSQRERAAAGVQLQLRVPYGVSDAFNPVKPDVDRPHLSFFYLSTTLNFLSHLQPANMQVAQIARFRRRRCFRRTVLTAKS